MILGIGGEEDYHIQSGRPKKFRHVMQLCTAKICGTLSDAYITKY